LLLSLVQNEHFNPAYPEVCRQMSLRTIHSAGTLLERSKCSRSGDPTCLAHYGRRWYAGGVAEGGSPREVASGEDAPKFGARLRWLREAAGLSQEELASRAGLSTKAVSMLERGQRKRPYPYTVRSLADALELSEGERAVLTGAIPGRSGDALVPVEAAATPPSALPTSLIPCWVESAKWRR